MNRVDDSGSPACGSTMNRLGILQVRVHHRGRIEEPCAQMLCRMICVATIACEGPGCSQSRNLYAQPNQRMPVAVEIVGIRHSVALNVGPIWVLWIGPPVIG